MTRQKKTKNPNVNNELDLTGKQLQFLQAVKSFTHEFGHAPSIREVGNYMGISSPATIHGYKSRLEKLGLIRIGSTRGLEVVEKEPTADAIALPLEGRVAAGCPIEALDHDERFEVPSPMVGGGQHFVLTVEGDSMIDEGIHDGDKVIIRKQSTANNGQVVVALIDNEATIKRIYHRKGKVELHPANSDYEIIHVNPTSNFKIEGVLKGVIRYVQ